MEKLYQNQTMYKKDIEQKELLELSSVIENAPYLITKGSSLEVVSSTTGGCRSQGCHSGNSSHSASGAKGNYSSRLEDKV